MPRFLDIEASSLNDASYPIEIAWSDEKGNIESHLINPYAIEEWTDWDFYAEHKIHGLSRFMCRELGACRTSKLLNKNIILFLINQI